MIQAITGPNFSGKSFYMQCYSGFPTESVRQTIKIDKKLFRDNRSDLYLGPIPDYFFSGFFSSVKNEVYRYHNPISFDEPPLKEYINNADLSDLYPRNPFTLSGGEKAIVSALSFAISNPRSLCIDCTLEQLGQDWKIPFLNLLLNMSLPEIILTDNRIAELPTEFYSKMDYKAIPEPHILEIKFPGIKSGNITIPNDHRNYTLHVNDLSFSYGNKVLFKNLNLQLETGKIYHLKGKNGVGKSTLSKILSGLLRPDKKTNIFLNQDKFVPYSRPGKFVGYTFQQPDDQLFSKSVEEELGLYSKRNPFKNIYIQSLTEAFGLMPLLNLHPFELPVSMRKRLSIAATLSVERPFYILDEPTLYLDDSNSSELKQVLNKLALSGKGIVLISHSKHFIDSFHNIETIDLNQN